MSQLPGQELSLSISLGWQVLLPPCSCCLSSLFLLSVGWTPGGLAQNVIFKLWLLFLLGINQEVDCEKTANCHLFSPQGNAVWSRVMQCCMYLFVLSYDIIPCYTVFVSCCYAVLHVVTCIFSTEVWALPPVTEDLKLHSVLFRFRHDTIHGQKVCNKPCLSISIIDVPASCVGVDTCALLFLHSSTRAYKCVTAHLSVRVWGISIMPLPPGSQLVYRAENNMYVLVGQFVQTYLILHGHRVVLVGQNKITVVQEYKR